MDMAGHTPGPWDAENADLRWIVVKRRPGKIFRIICRIPDGTTEEHAANARLIAAAPDLEAERDALQVLLTQAEAQAADNYREWGLCQAALAATDAENKRLQADLAITLAELASARGLAHDLEAERDRYKTALAGLLHEYTQVRKLRGAADVQIEAIPAVGAARKALKEGAA
jgi:chromosome segregation ATPase